jgi:hypothetical protein
MGIVKVPGWYRERGKNRATKKNAKIPTRIHATKRAYASASRSILGPGVAAVLIASNDEVERRGASPASNEGTLSQSSIPSLAHRRCDPRSLEPIVRRRTRGTKYTDANVDRPSSDPGEGRGSRDRGIHDRMERWQRRLPAPCRYHRWQP